MSTFGLPPDIRITLERSRLLLVDDNPQALAVESAMFRGFGVHRQYKAGSASEAINIVSTREVDLIVMDGAMPDMDGYDFVRWLRNEAPGDAAHIPVILLTGHAARHVVEKSRDCGANFVVSKPFTPQVLLQRVYWVAKDERAFVRSQGYVGPDRRVRNQGPPIGMRGRRSTDLSLKVGLHKDPNLDQIEIDQLLKPQRVNL
jgi:CheY-like chemotaxis protein